MKSFWHPLSTLLLADPRCYATPQVLRLLLRSGAEQQLIYAGDRMWPAIADGAAVTVEPWGDGSPAPGQIVLAFPAGIPDLLRVDGVDGKRLRLTADADPSPPIELGADEVPGRCRLPAGSRGRPEVRRLLLDLREAWTGRADEAQDPAETVLGKYDTQAPFYAGATVLDPLLLDELKRRLPSEGHLLVVGSGAGNECFALARAGWRVTGVDFSPAMIELARQSPEAPGLPVEFRQADVREYEPDTSFAGIVFTYDVYSFIPAEQDRTRTLQRMRSWLEPRGAVFLSARRVRSFYQRWILTLQWMRRGGDWGNTHTRWVAPDGRLRRSYVRMFGASRLARETVEAGYRQGAWIGGHLVLFPD